MAHDVFVSYSTADQTVAQIVCATLEKNGVRCWMAPRDVQPGDDWGNAIVEAIKASHAMVVVFSGAANESRHIPREIERAIGHEIPVVPVRIENVQPRGSLEYSLSSVHWLDAISPPIEAHIVKLADRLRPLLGRPDQGDDHVLQRGSKVVPPAPVPTPSSKRNLIIAGLVIAGIVGVTYAVSNQSKTPAAPTSSPGPTASPSSSPSSAAGPAPIASPTSTPEALRVKPGVYWKIFPAHQLGLSRIDPSRLAGLKREAADFPDDPRPAIDIGNMYFDARAFEPAIDWYLDALKRVPNHVAVRTDLAMMYWQIDLDDDALSHLRRVLDQEPRNAKALLNVGIVYATNKTLELQKAAECWRNVIEYHPGSYEASRAREMLNWINAR